MFIPPGIEFMPPGGIPMPLTMPPGWGRGKISKGNKRITCKIRNSKIKRDTYVSTHPDVGHSHPWGDHPVAPGHHAGNSLPQLHPTHAAHVLPHCPHHSVWAVHLAGYDRLLLPNHSHVHAGAHSRHHTPLILRAHGRDNCALHVAWHRSHGSHGDEALRPHI